MKWPSPAALALVYGAGMLFSWTGMLIALPFAVARGQFRYWLRETGFVLYCTVFSGALLAAYSYWG